MTKVVYIASAYTVGDKKENVKRQIDAAEKLRGYGFLPFWPLHSHYWHQYHPHTYQYWMCMDYEWIERCDILLRIPGESKGADKEVEFARELGRPVYYSISELVEKEYLA